MIFLKTVLIAGFMLLGLSVQAEESRISLSATNQPLSAALANIERASGIDVVLSDKKWAKEPVSFSVRNSDLEKTLDTVLSQYDYVLEWYADAGQFSKVLVTVYEKKVGIPGGLVEGGTSLFFAKDERSINAAGVIYAESVAHLQKKPQYPESLSQEVIDGIGSKLDKRLTRR